VPDPTDRSWKDLAAPALVAGSAGLLLYFFSRSLRWPLIHDAALMHYIAWLIAQGAVPYRDTFDMNMPGAYLIHLTVLAIGGPGDVTWRVFERGWLAATSVLAYFYCRPLCDRWSAAVAGLLFAIHHLGGGPSLAGQRDFLLCLFLLAGAYGVARSSERGGRLPPLLVAGLILGFATMVKPLAGLFLVASAGAAALGRYRAGRSGLTGAAAVAGAGLVVPALMLGWLAWIGGLRDLILILAGWTLPFYSQVGSRSSWHVLVSLNWALLGGLALLGALRSVPEPYHMRRALAVVGVAYGLLHFGFQGKGYDYHLYPLALFLCLLCALALAPETHDAGSERRRLDRHSRALAIGLVAVTIVVLGARGVERLNQPWEAQRAERVDAVVADLRKLLAPGETVQVLGPPGGHVLLRLGLRQPTRFFTDFQFYVWTTDPRIQALRAEFVAGLEARPPAAIVAFPGRDANGPYGRLSDFPALNQFLERRYAIAVEGNGYRIYARRPGASS
jgi:dolichyl-phosphate-mannose-protein mannosyltransferase